MEHIEDVYRKVCDNNWIGSLCKDFRLSVFDILYELFEKDIDTEHCRMCESRIFTANEIRLYNKYNVKNISLQIPYWIGGQCCYNY